LDLTHEQKGIEEMRTKNDIIYYIIDIVVAPFKKEKKDEKS